jgi:serine/threonine protein kinase
MDEKYRNVSPMFITSQSPQKQTTYSPAYLAFSQSPHYLASSTVKRGRYEEETLHRMSLPRASMPLKEKTPTLTLNTKVIFANKYSAIIQPPLDGHREDMVGKLFVVEKMYEKEKQIHDLLKDVDNDQRYLLFSKDTPIAIYSTDVRLSHMMKQHHDFYEGINKASQEWVRRGRIKKRNRAEHQIWQLSMPYGGISLENMQSIIPLDKFAKWMSHVCEGVKRIQTKHIVHQDLLARNIVVSPKDDTARIIDYGVATSYDHVFDIDANEDRLDTIYIAYPPEYHIVSGIKEVNQYWNSLGNYRRAYMKVHGIMNKKDMQDKYTELISLGKGIFKPERIDVYSVGMMMLMMIQNGKVENIPVVEKQWWMDMIKGMTTMNSKKRWTITKVLQHLREKFGRQPLSPPYIPVGSVAPFSPFGSPYKSMDSKYIRSTS